MKINEGKGFGPLPSLGLSARTHRVERYDLLKLECRQIEARGKLSFP